MRVLVADDDRQLSTLLCQMLQREGHQPVPAFDGATTLMTAMRSPAPDLILLDLHMPAGDGQTTLAKLKASSKTALNPVVVMSADTGEATRSQVRDLGASTFLPKPINPDTFIDVIEAFGPPPRNR